MIRTATVTATDAPVLSIDQIITRSDWSSGLPVLRAGNVTLRQLRLSDARSLHELLTAEEVARFIAPPPATVAGFERFIEWAHHERSAGRHVCFAVLPDGCDDAVGIFQIRQQRSTFEIAEWRFAIGRPYWGTGVFASAAPAVVDFTIEILDVRRLEARASAQNGRGNGALQKVGAIREAVLRKSFLKDGVHYDQFLWSICADEWRLGRRGCASVH